MANPYFRQLPSFEYVSRLPDSKISDYIEVKNLFKKGNIRNDIFQNVSFFEKYQIKGDDRPDNVAFKVYDDSTLDWVILLSNNILNIQTEWPLSQQSFDNYLRQKYGVGFSTEEEIYNNIYNGIHHYETIEIRNSQGVVIVPGGLEVPFDYALGKSYYDYFTDSMNFINTGNQTTVIPVTNYEYEEKIENKKRNIYVLKQRYLNIIIDDMKELMAYKEGATQNVSDTLKRADNIRLYS
jgi:hypothetical protein